MILAAVAPVAPVGGAAVALTLFLAYVTCLGLLWVYRATLSAIVLGVAHAISRLRTPGFLGHKRLFGPVADVLIAADNLVKDGLAFGAIRTEAGATWIFNLVADQLRAIGDEVGGLAYDLTHALDRTVTVTIPHAVKQRTAPIWRRIGRTEARLAAVAGTVGIAIPRLDRQLHEWIGRTAKQARAHARRLSRLEALFGAAAFAGAVAVALNRLGLRWIRCGALQRIGRRHGCAPWQLLELLLAPTVAILAIRDACSLAGIIQRAATEAEPAIRHMVAETENFMCGGTSGYASGIVAADRADSRGVASGVVAADLRL